MHVAAELLLLLLLLFWLLLLRLVVTSVFRFCGTASSAFKFCPLRRQACGPFEAFPFAFEGSAGGVQPVIVLARKPSGVNLVGNGVAEVGIILILRSFCQKLESFVGGSRVTLPAKASP